MDSIPLILFLGLLGTEVVGEYAAMARTGTLRRKHRREWTYLALALPFKAMIVAALLEHLNASTRPSLICLVAGSLLTAGGILVRVLGHLQLDGAFTPYVEKTADQQLVATGMYAKIRHPMYLGSLLLFLGMPMILGARAAWIFSALGILGTWLRIRKEEAFLSKELPGYNEYRQHTWRLLPYLY